MTTDTVTVFREKLEKEADFRQWLQTTARPWLQRQFGQEGALGGTDVRWWSTPIMMLLSALAAKTAGAGNWGTLGAALGGAGLGFAGGTTARQLAQSKGELQPGWWQEPYKGWLNSLFQQQTQQPTQQTAGIESTHPSTSVYPGGAGADTTPVATAPGSFPAPPTAGQLPPTEQMKRLRPY